MSWNGGGGGGGGWNNAARDSASAGLPFAGIPPELQSLLDRLLRHEPEHPEPEVDFDPATFDRRPLTMRRVIEPYRWGVAGAFLLVVLESLTLRLGPTLTQLGIDKGMGLENLGHGVIQGSRAWLFAVVAAYLFLVGLSVIVGWARVIWSGQVGERLLYSLRVRVFAHFQRLSLDFYTGEKAGRLMTRMTSDIDNLQQLFHEGIVQILMQGLTLVILTAQLFIFNAQLAWITLLVVSPVMVATTVWFQRASDRGYLVVRDRIALVLADLSESLAGIRLVTAHNRQRQNTIQHENIVGAYKDANNHTARLSGIYAPFSETIGSFAVLVVLLVGGNMVLDSKMQVGELTGFILALTFFFAPIQQLAQLYNTYQQGRAGMIKLRELLAIEPSVPERPDAIELPPVEGRITLDHVSFSYLPNAPVLRDVTLELQPGETFAFVGATGAGKSTIAKLVTRFYDPTAGRLLIDGHDLRDVTLASLRRQLGVVPQEPFLFNGTVYDNIVFGRPHASRAEVADAARAVGLADLVHRLPEGLDTQVHERGSSLSSGERQLLALARAFLARPRVLVLDEATSSLDLKSEGLIEAALEVVLEGRTAIVIAHRLATAMRADRIAVVGEGRILELGSHDELIARGGIYAEMFATWQRHAHADSHS